MAHSLILKKIGDLSILNQSSHFFSWDERRDVAQPGNSEETLVFAVNHFIKCAKNVLETDRLFSVALSGGSTPQKIFENLSSQEYSKQLDWTQILLFWSDERAVPSTHRESNFRMAMEAGLKRLPIPENHIFRMQAECHIQANAQAYQKTIQDRLSPHGLDLIMLGVGKDGHTASLFPGTKALKEKVALVVANEIPQKKTWRMTLTYPCINQANQIAIYAFGSSKAKIVEKVFLDSTSMLYPVSLIGTPQNKALWILDAEAAERLIQQVKHSPLK